MKNIRKFSMFESQSNLTTKEKERLERLERNADIWRNDFEKYAKANKVKEFFYYWDILKYIQEDPDLMASILIKLLDVKEFNEWVSNSMDDFPASFKDSMGLASDLKTLGF